MLYAANALNAFFFSDLRNNDIKRLDDATWKNLSNLIVLKLNKNDISVIPNDALSYQKQLKILYV